MTMLGGAKISMSRRFFQADETSQMMTAIASDIDEGIVPFVSIKTPGTWLDVASGQDDGWLASLVEEVGRVEAPVFLAVHHEPEDDSTENHFLRTGSPCSGGRCSWRRPRRRWSQSCRP